MVEGVKAEVVWLFLFYRAGTDPEFFAVSQVITVTVVGALSHVAWPPDSGEPQDFQHRSSNLDSRLPSRYRLLALDFRNEYHTESQLNLCQFLCNIFIHLFQHNTFIPIGIVRCHVIRWYNAPLNSVLFLSLFLVLAYSPLNIHFRRHHNHCHSSQ